MSSQFFRGIYSGQPEKFFPPPLKFFPVFVDFAVVFKLQCISTCVLSLFSFFSSFPPFSLPFFKSSFKFFPVFHFGQKNGQNTYPCIADNQWLTWCSTRWICCCRSLRMAFLYALIVSPMENLANVGMIYFLNVNLRCEAFSSRWDLFLNGIPKPIPNTNLINSIILNNYYNAKCCT